MKRRMSRIAQRNDRLQRLSSDRKSQIKHEDQVCFVIGAGIRSTSRKFHDKMFLIILLLASCILQSTSFTTVVNNADKTTTTSALLSVSKYPEWEIVPAYSTRKDDTVTSRRHLFRQSFAPSLLFTMLGFLPQGVAAEDEPGPPKITDKVYLTLKGIPPNLVEKLPTSQQEYPTIVIGLYGDQAPKSTSQLKLLFDGGLPAPCRPRVENRALQREQLEANKVYNSCMEGVDTPVNLQYSTIWRIIRNTRIDLGAVSGKFVAREYPTWTEDNGLLHDQFGTVSVRRGNDGGFGFMIYTGDGTANEARKELDQDNIVIGRVVEGLEIVKLLNEDIPVITSSKTSYMSLTGGPKVSNAPDRSCRYGGPMYCNENKPLVKLAISNLGLKK